MRRLFPPFFLHKYNKNASREFTLHSQFNRWLKNSELSLTNRKKKSFKLFSRSPRSAKIIYIYKFSLCNNELSSIDEWRRFVDIIIVYFSWTAYSLLFFSFCVFFVVVVSSTANDDAAERVRGDETLSKIGTKLITNETEHFSCKRW